MSIYNIMYVCIDDEYVCMYVCIDDLYNTRQIYPPGIVKIVYIIAMHALYIHGK